MKTTLFISDLHLDARRPAITTLFQDLLAGLDPQVCAGLYILGDLFEAWIGDDNDDAHDQRILAALHATTARGIPIWVMHGNRDFLLGETFAHATGCTLLADPTLIQLNGEPTLLMHGDTLCTDDHEYQQFRTLVRNPAWQQQFLAKPLAERRAIAANLRETSRQRTGEKDAEIMDVNPQTVEATLRAHGVRRLIHGHTHRPATHNLSIDGERAQRIVLGDWYEQGSVLRCDEDGLHLETLALTGQNHG
ncbi:MAG: UDP-2,3-diacylglucosamine diphosphatase [Gammaproteobacteria bacterium]|nr:UDP-2,3-diacylglucosamine diphosphatase [Gammaproteobacteria bacterium]